MNRLAFALSTCILAGCTTSPGSGTDLARYGTPPSEDDLYQYMSSLRDSLPPTRYVSYRDKGYANAVKKTTFTDQDGRQSLGWEYAFDIATYDELGSTPPQWSPHRAIFFNGRPIGLIDSDGRLIRGNPPDQVPAAASGQAH